MKTTKKIMMLLALVLTFSTSFAQNVASKELLCKKWIIDDESMKPIIMKMMKENPMSAGASEADLQMGLNMAMEQISGTKVEFKLDGTTSKLNKNIPSTGKWTLSTDGKELISISEGKPDRIFSFIEISKTKLSLATTDGKNFIYKPE
jgi:hypothetical protein